MHVAEIEPVGLTVDLEGGSGLDRACHDALDVDVRTGPPVELATREVTDAVDVRVVDGGEHALGRVPVERRVERGHDPVQLGEDRVVDVDRAVGPDIRLDAAKDAERLDAGVHLVDLPPLSLHPPVAQVVRVVCQREVAIPAPCAARAISSIVALPSDDQLE